MTDEKNSAEPSGASGGSMAWIPVTERLPGRNVHVIARCRGGQAMEYLYADGRFFRHGEERRVTHWQHFPEPPQDDE